MRTARRLFAFAVMPAVAAAAVAATAFAAPPEKVTVCHVTGSGTEVAITIAEPAVRAHLAHGDTVIVGEYGYCP